MKGYVLAANSLLRGLGEVVLILCWGTNTTKM